MDFCIIPIREKGKFQADLTLGCAALLGILSLIIQNYHQGCS